MPSRFCSACCPWSAANLKAKGSKLSTANQVVETTFHVRYAETDQMGIVHHSAYVVWLEEGRSHWLRANGRSYADFEREGLALAVSELQVRYGQPARYDQRVTIRCWIEEVKSRQVIFSYEVVEASTGTIFATGSTKHICIDQAGKVAKIPESWREFLNGQ
jgi:acyl-CoA thioester hydrolase